MGFFFRFLDSKNAKNIKTIKTTTSISASVASGKD